MMKATYGLIDNNVLLSATTAIWLSNQSSNCKVGSSNIFAPSPRVRTRVLNKGTNNSVRLESRRRNMRRGSVRIFYSCRIHLINARVTHLRSRYFICFETFRCATNVRHGPFDDPALHLR